jgi:glycosyltransferase involved in cell wall biosynthesis
MTAYGVVIPAFNAERTLHETLAAVLAQTTPAAEIVVVDDGSTDGTANLAATFSPQVRVVSQCNRGQGSATTWGIKEVSTPLVAMCDADDVWLPHKSEVQLRALAAHPTVALVSSQMRQFRHGESDNGRGEVRAGPTRSTIMMRRDVFFRVGDIIDPPGQCGEMVDWLSRFRDQGHRELHIEEVLALRRIIPGSLTYRSSQRQSEGLLAVAHRALQRRRGA